MLHPMTVHLPIGLLLGHAIFLAIFLWRRSSQHEFVAYQCLWLGWVTLLPAVITGTIDAARQVVGPAAPRTDALMMVNAHAAAGVALMVVYWQAWHYRRRHPEWAAVIVQRRAYLGYTALGMILLVLNGWLGGQLVYSLRLGVAQP
jgi:uncharacterized membrane protein